MVKIIYLAIRLIISLWKFPAVLSGLQEQIKCHMNQQYPMDKTLFVLNNKKNQ